MLLDRAEQSKTEQSRAEKSRGADWMLLWTGINGSSRADLQLLTNSWSWTLERDQRGIKMVEVVETIKEVVAVH